MEPIRPFEIFYKVFQPVNIQIFEYITQRMLLALNCYKRNCWTVRETHEHTEKMAVQKIHIDNGSEGIVSHPQVIEFQTVYSNERRTIGCDLETKNIPGVPDGRHEVFYIADTDEFIYGSDPKVSDYMNIIFAPSFVDILYKDITIIVTTLRMHQDTYEHEKEVQKRKMEHGETEDDKCDAAWQQTLLHLSETLRQMNTEHTGVRYETILFGRGKHTPPVLFAYVVHLPNNVLHGIIVIVANLNDDTALELRYYQTSSGLLPNADKTTVMSLTHTGVACSGYDAAYQKLCADVGKVHGDKIVGMVQETTSDPIKQKEEVMVDKNKWVAKLENIHNKIQQFNDEGERFTIESNFAQWGDNSAQITVYLRDKADDEGEPFGEIRYTVNEKHCIDSTAMGREAKWDAGLTIRYFSNIRDVHWCEPLSIVDAGTGQYIVRKEPEVMLKDLGSRWTDKFIGLLKAEADKPIKEEINKKEECAMSERTHTIELSSLMIRKGVLPEECDERHHIAIKIFSDNDDVHKRIFKMYEDCPLDLSTDTKRRYMPYRDGNATNVVIFVPDADEIDMGKVYDYYSTITLSLESLLVPGSTLINAVVKHIKVPSIGEWDELPKKQHEEEKCESEKEPVKPTEDKWVRFIEDMEKMFKRQNDKPRFKHMKFETKFTNGCANLDVKCFMNNDRIGLFTIRMNNRPNDSVEHVPVVIRFFPESEGYCQGIYWIDGCKHATLHINKQTGDHRPFYDDMVRTVGIKFVQFFEQWLKNKLEFVNAFDCEKDIENDDEDDCVAESVDGKTTIVRLKGVRIVRVSSMSESRYEIEIGHIGYVEIEALKKMYKDHPIENRVYDRVPQSYWFDGMCGISMGFFDAKSFGVSQAIKHATLENFYDIEIELSGGSVNPIIKSILISDVKLIRSPSVMTPNPLDKRYRVGIVWESNNDTSVDAIATYTAFDKRLRDINDVPTVDSRITAPHEFTLRNVAIHVLPHSQATNTVFIEFAPISELEKRAILDMYSNTPLGCEEAKRRRVDPQFWQIRGTHAFRVRLCVFFSSSEMLHRLEAVRPYERFDVKLLIAKGQVNITVKSLTSKKRISGSIELFESPTETESIEKRTKQLVANSTYGMMTRSFGECIDEAAQQLQAIDPESDAAKKLEESILAISANPGETIWIDSLGCKNETKTGGTTMKGTSISTSVSIEKLFFSGTTTIVMWTDGTKTVVQPIKGEKFDPEIGIAMAIARKIFGSRHQFDKFTANVFRESYARDAKSLTERELLMLLPEYEKIIAEAKAKHDSVHQAYEKAVSEGSKKLPKLYGLKSDPDYRYAAIRATVIKAELESRKAEKAARAASTKKDTKKPTTAKKSSTRKKSTK